MKVHEKKKVYRRQVQKQFKAGKIPNASDGMWRNPVATDGSMSRDAISGARHGAA